MSKMTQEEFILKVNDLTTELATLAQNKELGVILNAAEIFHCQVLEYAKTSLEEEFFNELLGRVVQSFLDIAKTQETVQ